MSFCRRTFLQRIRPHFYFDLNFRRSNLLEGLRSAVCLINMTMTTTARLSNSDASNTINIWTSQACDKRVLGPHNRHIGLYVVAKPGYT